MARTFTFLERAISVKNTAFFVDLGLSRSLSSILKSGPLSESDISSEMQAEIPSQMLEVLLHVPSRQMIGPIVARPIRTSAKKIETKDYLRRVVGDEHRSNRVLGMVDIPGRIHGLAQAPADQKVLAHASACNDDDSSAIGGRNQILKMRGESIQHLLVFLEESAA